MRSKKTQAIPARLEAGRRRFERGCRTRKGHSRIPNPLWRSAVKLVGVYGLCRTARALRLDYYTVKKRGNAAAPHDLSAQQTAAAFVELVPPQRASVPESVVAPEDPRGISEQHAA